MADKRLSVERILQTGLIATYSGSLLVADTHQVRNSGRVFLHFKKSAAVDCVVTVQTPKQVAGLDVAELAVTVPASTGDKFIGPFPPSVFNVAAGDLEVTLSDVDGLTVAVLEL